MVMWNHSYAIAGVCESEEPLTRLVGIGPSFIAVNVFFIISGYLVSSSYCRSRTLRAYLEARFLRIFPGLVVCVLFCSLVIGGLLTTLPALRYYTSRDVWEFVFVNSTLLLDKIQLRYFLPGVFANNPLPGTVNGSLWTLPYELWLYIGLGVFGLFGFLNRRALATLLLLGFSAIDLTVMFFFPDNSLAVKFANVERFSLYFALGTVIYLNRASIPISSLGLVTVCATTAVLWQTGLAKFLFPFALAYLTFWLAHVPGGLVREYNRIGDLSYGTYIYAFPMEQVLLSFLSSAEPLVLFLLSLPMTLCAAALSWHLIEKRALARKGSVAYALSPKKAEA